MDDEQEGDSMIEKEITITIKDGLHARPAAELVKNLSQFSSSVQIYNGSREYNAKSILSMMSASFREGQIIKVIVNGTDEEETVTWLTSFL
jgi:catabolite repression HPr-like protein/phosphocarrier protein